MNFHGFYNSSSIEKLDFIIKQTWELFICKFLMNRYSISTEAPFQHHLANNIRAIGESFCFRRSETFFVDLETKVDDLGGKRKYIDITVGFYDNDQVMAKAAIELKFKKRSQGADDFARIDAYSDIESLELCLEKGFDLGYFFMISDYDIFIKESRPGTTGDIFSMREGYTPPVNVVFQNPNCKGRCDVKVILKRKHTYNWKGIEDKFFLALPIHKNPEIATE
ncbi:hypothetical protein P3W42_13560 [Bacillus paranthracis]|uniref:hypothetical protein n=1 Tax=Bacillus paranthracis TaxID=2026186 RepID=UPI002FDC1F17